MQKTQKIGEEKKFIFTKFFKKYLLFGEINRFLRNEIFGIGKSILWLKTLFSPQILLKSAYLGSIMFLSLYILIYNYVNVKITLIALFWDVLNIENILVSL